MKIDPKVLSSIKLIFFDFDGVFTDNFVYVSENGGESVKCWRSDGQGLNRVKSLGIKIYIISTEINPVVSVRAKKLNLDFYQGVENKSQTILKICQENHISPKNTIFVGNDINDISAFQTAGVAIGVADSHEEIYPYVDFLTKKNGGKGAVREICDLVFNANK